MTGGRVARRVAAAVARGEVRRLGLARDERAVSLALGYARGTKRRIDVAPVAPPLTKARPPEVLRPQGARGEKALDGVESTG